VEPVVVDGECIVDGEKLLLMSNQVISLRKEDMSVLAEYEIRFPMVSAKSLEALGGSTPNTDDFGELYN
jgi:hypothetical protein